MMKVREPNENKEIRKLRKGTLKIKRKTENIRVKTSVVNNDMRSGVGFLITLQIYSLRL